MSARTWYLILIILCTASLLSCMPVVYHRPVMVAPLVRHVMVAPVPVLWGRPYRPYRPYVYGRSRPIYRRYR